MFERYTERARRTIFFARYEASHVGSQYIETEHLLLGLLREDKALAIRRLGSSAALEAIRRSIAERSSVEVPTSTSVDLPLSHESKRALAHAADESARMSHQHIDTEHLLLGLLRVEKSFAAQLLHDHGVTLEAGRESVQESESARAATAESAGLDRWLAEIESRGGIVMPERTGNRKTSFAIYTLDQPVEQKPGGEAGPSEDLVQIRRRIDFIRKTIERAVLNHEFEKARFYSEEERKLREQHNLDEAPPEAPLVWIEVIRDERFADVQRRCDRHIAEGAAEVWLLDPELRRAYTVTKADGLREFRGEMLRVGNPPLEMELNKIFSPAR
jgi:hypothetical protein